MENIIYSPSGSISIRINEDKMSAWMYIHKTGKIIDEQEILDLMQDAGIRFGFDEALEWMAENGYNKDFEKPFPVAICKATVDENQVKLHFEPSKSYQLDKEWNFKDITNWSCVEPGKTLADIPLSDFLVDTNSYNIFGEPASDVANMLTLNSYLGNNVSLDVENKKIVSDISGYPYLDSNNKINVTDKLVYLGDIKFLNIPVTIGASLTVEGSINKTHLSMTKDLTVKGNVISSEIYSEGNLVVEGEVMECQGTGIVVTKDIKANSITDSLVMCMGNLDFEGSIAGSRIIAENKISGNTETSQIYGSQILSSKSIDVANVGNEEGLETEVEVTVSPFLKERLGQMNKVLEKLALSPSLNAGKIEQFSKKIKTVEEDLSKAMNKFLNTKPDSPRFVKVRNQLYKKAYIRVLKNSYVFKQNQTNVEFNEA